MAAFQPEYQRVKKGICSIIQQKTPDDLKMPTEFELCRIFDVGRTTVRRAIKDLTLEGLLVARPGMGTYVSKVSHAEASRPVQALRFAYTHNSGQLASFWRENALKFMPVIDFITGLDGIVDFVTFSSSGKDAARELVSNNIRGFFWAGPFRANLATLSAVRDAGIKVIITESFPWDGFNTVGTDGFMQGRMAAEYLISHGCRNPLYITHDPSEPVYQWKLDGFIDAFRKAGIPGVYENAIRFAELEPLLKYRGNIDGIFMQGRNLPEVKNILSSHGLDVPGKCRIVTVRQNEEVPFLREQLAENGRIAAGKMLELVQGKIKEPFKILTKPELVMPA